jgi:hypothetical protein
MKHSVAEDGVEFRLVRQFFTMDHISLKAESSGCLNLRLTRVHSDHVTPALGEFLRKHSIAATKIENSLTRLWRKKLQNRRT